MSGSSTDAEPLVFLKEYPGRRGPGRYVFANRAFKESVGLTSAEVVDRTDFDLYPAAIAKVVADNDLTVIGTGIPHSFETASPGACGPAYRAVKIPLFQPKENLFAVAGVSNDPRLIVDRPAGASEDATGDDGELALSTTLPCPLDPLEGVDAFAEDRSDACARLVELAEQVRSELAGMAPDVRARRWLDLMITTAQSLKPQESSPNPSRPG
ncbi:MAG: hypothetical protein JJLCMIEE_01175 [Acidimicrobiales bacterium]|nr:hypothetical protein [Acidimicrobiales bacterium]